MSSSLSNTELASSLFNYCRENKGVIVDTIYYSLMGNKDLPTSLSEWLNVLEIGATEIPLTGRTTKSILQRGNMYAFEPTVDAVSINPRLLKTMSAKVDLEIFPQELEKTFLAIYRRKNGSIINDEIIWLQYILADIFGQIQEDARFCAIQGNRVGSGTANTLAHAFDGFEKLWTSLVAASKLSVITPVVSTYITEKIESIFDALDPRLKNSGKSVVVVADDVFTRVIRENKAGLGRKWDYTNDLKTVIKVDGFPASIVLEPNFVAGRVLATKKGNLFLGMDSMADLSNLQFESEKRKVNMLGDFKFGVQVAEARPTGEKPPMVIGTV